MRRLLVLLGLLVLAAPAQAGLVIEYGDAYTGSDPSGIPPWLRATFENDGSGGVNLTLENLLQASTEYISQVVFNYNVPSGGPPLTALSATQTGGTAGAPGTFDTAPSLVNGWGDAGKFTWGFQFPTANGSTRFQMGETVTFNLKSSSGSLDTSFFNALSVGDIPLISAAHVQSIDANPSSGKIAGGYAVVPEPSTLAMGAVGVALCLGVVSRQRGKNPGNGS